MTSNLYDLVPADPSLQVYNKSSGELIAKVPLPLNAQGSPMTYVVGGKQFIAKFLPSAVLTSPPN